MKALNSEIDEGKVYFESIYKKESQFWFQIDVCGLQKNNIIDIDSNFDIIKTDCMLSLEDSNEFDEYLAEGLTSSEKSFKNYTKENLGEWNPFSRNQSQNALFDPYSFYIDVKTVAKLEV